MTFKEHIRKNITLAFPVMLTQAGQILVNIADNVMVGGLGGDSDIIQNPEMGKLALGAVSLGSSMFVAIMVLAIGFSFAMSPLIAQADAKNKYQRGADVFSHGLVLNVLISIILWGVLLLLTPMLNYMDQPPEVVKLAIPYLEISAISLIPLMIFQSFRQLSEGLSLTKVVAFATIFANLVNVLLNYGWIYGNLGFPRLEVEGAAYGTLVSRIVMIFALLLSMYFNKKTKHYLNLVSFKKFKTVLFRKLVQLGFPTAGQMFFEVGAFAMAAFICGKVSDTDLAAHQIAINLASTTFMLCTGLGVAATIRVGNQYGLKDPVAMRRAGWSNVAMVTFFMLFCGITLILFRTAIAGWYVDNEEVVALAAQLLIIAALFQLSDGIQVVIIGALRGMQDVLIPSVISLVAYCVIAIPLGYYLAIEQEIGAFGVWIGLGVGLTISAIALIFRFRQKLRQIGFVK